MEKLTDGRSLILSYESISRLSIFVVFMIMLWSMSPWFLWSFRAPMIFLLSGLFIFLRLFIQEPRASASHLIIFFLGFLLISEMTLPYFAVSNTPGYLRRLTLLFFVILMKPEEKIKLISFTTKVYAGIISISIVLYILVVVLGISLPYFITIYDSDIAVYPNYQNYLFLLVPDDNRLFIRFQSVFTEPGHLGMISALLLYVNHYRIKRKSVFIIFLSVIMSFSLAAYLLLMIGYAIHEVASGKRILKKVVTFLGIVGILVCGGIYIYQNYADSMVSQLIISRLEYDEESGIAGNNRDSEDFDYYYDNTFFKKKNWILGIGSEEYKNNVAGGSSSYKVFIVQSGIVGLVLLVFFYLSIVYWGRSKLILGLFLLYSISFIQRPYALWEIQLFMFISAAELFRLTGKLNRSYESENKLLDNNTTS